MNPSKKASDYEILGKMAALVAHDLRAPLHSIQYCVAELMENPNSPQAKHYIERIASNTDRAIELVDSIRARYTNPSKTPACASFMDTHRYVIKFLALQTKASDFEKIQVSTDPALEELQLNMTQMDLVHILDNIYCNSIANLIENSVTDAKLDIYLERFDSGRAQLRISDSGTGLSLDQFENCKEGLGLRLIRKLVQELGGRLSLILPPEKGGTTFQLELKCAEGEKDHT